MAGKRSIGRLVGIMLVIVVAGILVAKSFYANRNRSVDPRIQTARQLYEKYNVYAARGDYQGVFALLDSIGQIYSSVPHYQLSFELGVLENNRAAAMLTLALYSDSIPQANNPFNELTSDSLVNMAGVHIQRAICLYEQWNRMYSGKSQEDIREFIQPSFVDGLEEQDPDMTDKYIDNRVEEIEEALTENARRLSVCYTNLGLIYRYQGAYEEAAIRYKTAIELWDRNLDAENNLNKLLNRPIKKRNFIQRMFPPERN